MKQSRKRIYIALAGMAAVIVVAALLRFTTFVGDLFPPEDSGMATITDGNTSVDRVEMVVGHGQSHAVTGDLILSGSFDTVTITAGGTADDYVEVVADAEKGAKMTCLIVEGNYVRVSGVEVSGCHSHGIFVTGRHVIVENSAVHDTVTENGMGTCTNADQWGSGIKLGLGGDYAIIRNNQVYENCGEGIAATRARFALILENTTRDNFGVNIYVDNSPYAMVRNNHVLCTGLDGYMRNGERPRGIALGEEYYEGWGAQRGHDVIAGNYIDGCLNGIASYESDVDGTLKDIVISGNIINDGFGKPINMKGANENVLIENNRMYGEVYISDPAGVTLSSNEIVPPPLASPTPIPSMP